MVSYGLLTDPAQNASRCLAASQSFFLRPNSLDVSPVSVGGPARETQRALGRPPPYTARVNTRHRCGRPFPHLCVAQQHITQQRLQVACIVKPSGCMAKPGDEKQKPRSATHLTALRARSGPLQCGICYSARAVSAHWSIPLLTKGKRRGPSLSRIPHSCARACLKTVLFTLRGDSKCVEVKPLPLPLPLPLEHEVQQNGFLRNSWLLTKTPKLRVQTWHSTTRARAA